MLKAPSIKEITEARDILEAKLLAKRNDKGVWDGRLSSSALSTAVSVFALHSYDANNNAYFIRLGLNWLKTNVNADGGYGDTIKSSSNLSTSLLCWSALSIVKDDEIFQTLIQNLEEWLSNRLGDLKPGNISQSILTHYKTDRTFSVPILTMCALAGRLGENGWKYVPQLPFQLAALPHQLFKWMKLTVVSYALPALIAIGLVKQHNSPTKNPLLKLLNKWMIPEVLRILLEKQPQNGGFLEASPLTSFVLMSMIGAGQINHEVCRRAEAFLKDSIREDGGWSIDTSLTTWVTTLSVNALSDDSFAKFDLEEKRKIFDWLNGQQHLKIHPFTKARPGGWAWIDLEGGVPDGDDTSGALIAMHRLSEYFELDHSKIAMGINWLINNQNLDGGFPTFCRGWGKLPFDASCADVTAHAIRALFLWKEKLDASMKIKIEKSIRKAINYLIKAQRKDGSWLPLWFGNENDENHLNPVYGTSLVLIALVKAKNEGFVKNDTSITKALEFLKSTQNEDGGWGANKNVPSSIEETSLALRTMALFNESEIVKNGARYLIDEIMKHKDSDMPAEPIGLYFASLWYFEDMYPLTFACSALNTIVNAYSGYNN